MKRLTVSPDVLAANPALAGALRTEDSADSPVEPDIVEHIGSPHFRSGLELRAWSEWLPSLGPMVLKAWYEPFSLSLHTEGVKLRRYTPDIVLKVRRPNGNHNIRLWIVEVKPSWKAHASGRSSKINFEHAAAEYADLGRFFVLMPAKGRGEWTLTEVIAHHREEMS